MPDPSASLEEQLVRSKSPAGVRQMFHDIAPTYDQLNHLLSLNIDKRWRAKTAALLMTSATQRVLDVCSGTGDLVLSFSNRAKQLGTQPAFISSDFTPAMCTLAKQKFRSANMAASVLVADTLQLPFPDGQFDLVSVAFGIRNVADLQAGLREMMRVCRPGGRIAVLEFSHPRTAIVRQLYHFYFLRVLPWIGRLISGTRAYTYLPKSVAAFPDAQNFASLMREVTGANVTSLPFSFGIATLFIATRPGKA